MNTQEHHLLVLAEEAVEVATEVLALATESLNVAKASVKALRFGLDTIEPGCDQSNAQRLWDEMNDFMGAWELFHADTSLPPLDTTAINAKKSKINQYLHVSRSLGTLTDKEPAV